MAIATIIAPITAIASSATILLRIALSTSFALACAAHNKAGLALDLYAIAGCATGSPHPLMYKRPSLHRGVVLGLYPTMVGRFPMSQA
jgi:hypothetical protein